MRLSADQRPILLAAATAVALLLMSGGAYRLLAGYLDRPTDSVPMPRGTLPKALPLRIGEWQGKEKPVEEAVVKGADCDDYISRTYSRGAEVVQLWIAYGVRARDLMPHRPEVCYPGNGYTLEDTRSVELLLGGGHKLECRTYQFSRGGLGAGPMTVLNYYIVDGQYSPDVSLLRSKALRGSSGIRYMAQVQVVASGGGGAASGAAAQAVRAFAVDSAGAIRAVMPDVAKTQPPVAAGLDSAGGQAAAQ
ncbi:MAG: EpsI family protein [Planctomycetota bacterium]|nr:EpsI family protein [Planctomycetota bacterium]